MSGRSKKIMHPYMDLLMQKLDCKHLSEMALKVRFPLATLRAYAFDHALPRSKETADKLAKACGVSYDELMSGLLSTGTSIHGGALRLERANHEAEQGISR